MPILNAPPVIRFPRQGNQFWPLPSDYDQLSGGGQKLARVNACRMFGNPDDAIESWRWFKRYYLMPDPTSGFDPAFYKAPIHPTPPLHYNLIRTWAQYNYNMLCWPRECAKSTMKRSMILWLLTNMPRYEIASFLATDTFAIDETVVLRTQIETNSRLIEDFGELWSEKGSGQWNVHTLGLRNGAQYKGLSIDGKKRGQRPDWAVVDDVEDDKGVERTEEDRKKLREQIVRIILPMVGGGRKLTVMGTLLNKRSFLYSAVVNEDADPRFKSTAEGGYWHKQHVAAFDDRGRNVWRAKYTSEFLSERRAMMGEAAFRTEYLNDPQSEEGVLFKLGPEHEYEVVHERQEAPTLGVVPTATATVTYKPGPKFEAVTRVAGPWLESLHKRVTVDYAPGLSPGSDYSAIVVTGQDSANDLWVLDAWHGKLSPDALSQKAWDMAIMWRCSLMGVEAVSIQQYLYEHIREFGERFRDQNGWLPACVPVRYPANYSKESRIAGLEWRFRRQKIWFPRHLRQFGSMAELWKQVSGFTGDAKSLAHDDLVDALHMVQFVGARGAPAPSAKEAPKTAVELLADGQLYLPGTQILAASCVDFVRLPEHLQETIIEHGRQRQMDVLAEIPPQGFDTDDTFYQTGDLLWAM